MVLLRTTRSMLTWFGMLQDKNLAPWKKFASAVFSLINLVLIVILLVTSAIFAKEFVSIDLGRSLMAISQILAYSPILYMLLVTLVLRSKITALIGEIMMIFNSIHDHDLKRFIVEANNESEWTWKMYIKYIIVGTFVIAIVPSVGSVLWSLNKHGNLDPEHLYHQFEYSLPWNTKTPLGWVGEILFGTAASEVYMALVGTTILTFISFCLYHRAFYLIFKYSLEKIDDSVNEDNKKKMLCDLIRFHNTAKRLFFHSAEIWSHFILVVMLPTSLGLACIVFQIDLGLKHMDSKLSFLPIPFIMLNFVIFVHSYYGLMATESYENMSQCLFESNWRKLSIELQQFVGLMIQNTQKPIYYHGFGIFYLNLETYTKIVATYYMMQKTITNRS